MSNKVRSGLYFGTVMTFCFLVKTIIAWIAGEEEGPDEIVKSIVAAVTAGLFSGLLFGWLTDRFMVGGIFAKSMDFKLDLAEMVIFKTAANHFKGMEAVGGALCMTDQRIIFKSHTLNIQNHESSILLTDIQLIARYKTLGVFNNGLVVQLKSGTTVRFVVEKADQWMDNYQKTKQHPIVNVQ